MIMLPETDEIRTRDTSSWRDPFDWTLDIWFACNVVMVLYLVHPLADALLNHIIILLGHPETNNQILRLAILQ